MQKRICGREQEFGYRIRPTPHFGKDQPGLEEWQKKIMTTLLLAVSKVAPSVFSTRPSVQLESEECPLDYIPPEQGYSTDGQSSPPPPRLPPRIGGSEDPETIRRQPGPGVYSDLEAWEDHILWLSNGAAVYLDMRVFLEVASAECLAGSLDIVKQEKATEWILNQAIKDSLRRLNLEEISLFKNNTSPLGFTAITYGSHQNYSYKMDRVEAVHEWMRNFIPAALPLTGNGHVAKTTKGKFHYRISQRASFVELADGRLSLLGKRGLIDPRAEHHTDSDKSQLARLHVVARDGTRCEYQTWLVDAVTHLVIRLGEEGHNFPRKLRLMKPVREMHRLNARPNLNYRIQTRSGRKEIIEYNRIFLKAAKKLKPLSKLEKKTLQEWERVLDLLEARKFKKLVGELDWITKDYLLRISMAKRGFNLSSIVARRINEDYHNISESPKKSLFAWLDKKGLIRHLVSRKEISRFVARPPETRAKARGKLVKRCLGNKRLLNRIWEINWPQAQFKGKGNAKIVVKFGKVRNLFSASLRGWKKTSKLKRLKLLKPHK
ncbi:MAG: proteasome accessory factor PafA2 family protein [bacterium]|nr:proteasome accessory factor PafA2 family protein [bacterium]